jgi:hypothetical protein
MERQNAHAGPSKPRKKPQKKGEKLSKAKMESKGIDELDQLAMSFVSVSNIRVDRINP